MAGPASKAAPQMLLNYWSTSDYLQLVTEKVTAFEREQRGLNIVLFDQVRNHHLRSCTTDDSTSTLMSVCCLQPCHPDSVTIFKTYISMPSFGPAHGYTVWQCCLPSFGPSHGYAVRECCSQLR